MQYDDRPRNPSVETDAVRRFAEGILNTTPQPFVILDAALRVEMVNPAFCRRFEVSEENTTGRPLYELGNQQWDIPELRKLLQTVLDQGSRVEEYRVEHDFQSIGRRVMLVDADLMDSDDASARKVLLAISDVTDRGRAAQVGAGGAAGIRGEDRRCGPRSPPRPSLGSPGQDGQLAFLRDIPRRSFGDRRAHDLRARQRPVGHSAAARAAGKRPAGERGVRRLRSRARLRGHRPSRHAAQCPPDRPHGVDPAGDRGHHGAPASREAAGDPDRRAAPPNQEPSRHHPLAAPPDSPPQPGSGHLRARLRRSPRVGGSHPGPPALGRAQGRDAIRSAASRAGRARRARRRGLHSRRRTRGIAAYRDTTSGDDRARAHDQPRSMARFPWRPAVWR